MLVELNKLPKCHCEAVFLDDAQLERHVRDSEQYKLLLKEFIRFTSAQLGRLLYHSRAQDSDDKPDIDSDDKPYLKHKDTTGAYHCPSCEFTARKPYELKKHFGRHIPLYREPPCLLCGNSAETVAEYLDHTKLHHDDSFDSDAKRVFTSSRCEELRLTRDEQLTHSLPNIKRPLRLVRGEKRKRTVQKNQSGPTTSLVTSSSVAQSRLHSTVSGSTAHPPLPWQGTSTFSTASSTSAECIHGHGSYFETGIPPNQHAIPASGAVASSADSYSSAQNLRGLESSGLDGNPFLPHFSPQISDQLSHEGPEPPATRDLTLGHMAVSMNSQIQLEMGSVTARSTGFDSNAATHIPVAPMAPLPDQQRTGHFASMGINDQNGVGSEYGNFGRIVGAFNFPFE